MHDKFAAMQLDEALDQRQAEASARLLAGHGRLRLSEGLENGQQILRIDAGTPVLDFQLDRAVLVGVVLMTAVERLEKQLRRWSTPR